jgi:hypothetical protein
MAPEAHGVQVLPDLDYGAKNMIFKQNICKKINKDKMCLDKMPADKMTVGKMACCHSFFILGNALPHY